MVIKRKIVMENPSGSIPAFGAFVDRLPAALSNGFARQTEVSGSPSERAEHLLVNASQECGYHTGRGIVASGEWQAEQAPEDILRGAFAALREWGWADSEIVELVPRERLVVRAGAYFESDADIYGTSPKPCAYMLRGISAAFMDLAYGGQYDATGRTGLGTFHSVQTKGIECGDEHGEFVVTRSVA